MAIGNLSAAQIGEQGGGLEPQRQNHWFIEINFDANIATPTGVSLTSPSNFDVIKLALQRGFNPSSAQEEVAVPWVNEIIYFAGKHIPESGTLELVDWVDRPVADVLWEWRRRCYNVYNGHVGLAANYKQTATVLNFAPNGDYVRYWTLEGVWPLSINYGSLDMSTSNPLMLAVTLRFDRYYRTSALISSGRGTNPA